MHIGDLNIAAIIVSAIVYFVIGAIWYSPALFGKDWMRLTGTRKEDCKCTAMTLVGAFINALVISCVMAYFVHALHATTAYEGSKIGFLAWLGFVLPIKYASVLWERQPLALFIIHVACLLLNFIVIGGILAVWP